MRIRLKPPRSIVDSSVDIDGSVRPKSWQYRSSAMAKANLQAAAAGLTKAQILERAEREKVKFMRLQFTDILGTIKNVEIPDRQFEEALDGKIMFDGSSIEGFVRIEESDMYLRPDLVDLPRLPVGRRRPARRSRG